MITFRLSEGALEEFGVKPITDGKTRTNNILVKARRYRVNTEKLDIPPRNIYLSQGRILKKEEVDEYLDKIAKLSFREKVANLMKRISKLVK